MIIGCNISAEFEQNIRVRSASGWLLLGTPFIRKEDKLLMNKMDRTTNTVQKDSVGEINELLQKLSSWSNERQESQRWLNNLLSMYSGRFYEDTSALKEEVRDLKTQLAYVTKERNDVQESNKILGIEIRQQRDKFAMFKTLLEMEEKHNYAKQEDGQEGTFSDLEEVLKTPRKLSETSYEAEHDEVDNRRFGQLNKNHSYNWDELSPSSVESTSPRKGEAELEEVTDDMIAEFDLNEKQDILEEKDHEKHFYERLSDRQQMIYTNMLKNRRPKEVESEVKQKKENQEDNEESTDQTPTPKAGDAVVIPVIKLSKGDLRPDINDLHDKTRNHFRCDKCPYTSAYKKNLRAHKERVHENIKNHACEKCKFASHSKSDLKKHIKEVHANIREHVCKECGHAFSRKSSFNQHMVSVHNREPKFSCDMCPYTSEIKNGLRVHKERVHDKIKNHACELCRYATHSTSDLRKHIEGVHAKIRNHVCTECGSAFSQNGSLYQHMRSVHYMKVKQLKCGICPYKTSNKWHLKSHSAEKHEKIKNHFCAECGYPTTEEELKKHNDGDHQVQLTIVT